MCSPHSIEPWVDRIVKIWWSLEKQFMHIFQRSERDLEIPHQKWQTDGNPACGWVRAPSQTNTLSEQTMELCMREVYDDSQRIAGEKRTSRHSSRPPQKPRSMTTGDATVPRAVPEVHEHENMNMRIRTTKRTRTMMRTEKYATSQTTSIMTWRRRRYVELKPRREAHRNTRECVREKTVDG